MDQIRQGDVYLIPVVAIPATATPVAREAGRLILAHGEVTGHAHAILAPDAELLTTPGATAELVDRYLRVRSSAPQIDAWRVRSRNGIGWMPAYQPREIIEAAGFVVEARESVQGVVEVHEEHLHHVIRPGVMRVVIHEEWTDQDESRAVLD